MEKKKNLRWPLFFVVPRQLLKKKKNLRWYLFFAVPRQLLAKNSGIKGINFSWSDFLLTIIIITVPVCNYIHVPVTHIVLKSPDTYSLTEWLADLLSTLFRSFWIISIFLIFFKYWNDFNLLNTEFLHVMWRSEQYL